jgi:hypothetical protein
MTMNAPLRSLTTAAPPLARPPRMNAHAHFTLPALRITLRFLEGAMLRLSAGPHFQEDLEGAVWDQAIQLRSNSMRDHTVEASEIRAMHHRKGQTLGAALERDARQRNAPPITLASMASETAVVTTVISTTVVAS